MQGPYLVIFIECSVSTFYMSSSMLRTRTKKLEVWIGCPKVRLINSDSSIYKPVSFGSHLPSLGLSFFIPKMSKTG